MRDIKYYLHLYFGCEMINPYGQIHKLTFYNYETLLVWGKPILRHLDNMTKEEKDELFSILGISKMFIEWGVTISDGGFLRIKHDKTSCIEEVSIHAFKFLLDKHFDLFGLIEAGIAIDKTTLKLKT